MCICRKYVYTLELSVYLQEDFPSLRPEILDHVNISDQNYDD